MRFPKVLTVLALSLALPACAADIALSGTVMTDTVTRAGISGVAVSLAKGKLSATTDANGSWSIVHKDVTTGLAVRAPTTSGGSHLSVQDGRILLRYGGHDLLGHVAPRPAQATASPASARSADAGSALDTLLFSWKDSVRVRLPIANYTQNGIVTVLDTSSILDSTFGIAWKSGITYGILTDTRDGHAYRTVTIGSQRWMAQNLNFSGSGTVIGACYGNSADSCVKYGRLYTWAEAVDAPSAYNATSLNARLPRQGICPTGWHVPSDAEWRTLEVAIGMDLTSAASTNWRNTYGEGAKLKSIAGWPEMLEPEKNGTDVYGFRVLPAGYRETSGSFYYAHEETFFWAASEGRASMAWRRYLYYDNGSVGRDGEGSKGSGYSLRCLENSSDTLTTLHALVLGSGTLTFPLNRAFDSTILSYTDSVESTLKRLEITALASSSSASLAVNGEAAISGAATSVDVSTDTTITIVVSNLNTLTTRTYAVRVAHKATPFGIPWSANVAYGTVVDGRDNQSYRTVKIGDQTWMAQNLNYAGTGTAIGTCYGGSADSCAKYGRLYTWSQAMDGAASSSANPSRATGICPAGWHVPSDAEWTAMAGTAEASPGVGSGKGGTALKSAAGWNDASDGTDLYGFRGLPGGVFNGAAYSNVDGSGVWWTATENLANAWFRGLNSNSTEVNRQGVGKTFGLSLRCVEDPPLRSLSLSSGSLAPAFDGTVLSYTDSVADTTETVRVTATASSPDAVVTVNGTKVPSGSATSVDATTDATIAIVVTNPGTSTTRTYSVLVAHKAPPYGIGWRKGIKYGTLVDDRDGKAYRTVQIGTQTWMAENLNYAGSGTTGECYNGSADTCSKYGRMYSWAEAMALSSDYDATAWGGGEVKRQGLCPADWHVPSDAEWTNLTTSVGTAVSGYVLKSESGWSSYKDGSGATQSGNGSDVYGFRVLPATYRYSIWTDASNKFNPLPSGATFFWTASETDASTASIRRVNYNETDVLLGASKKVAGVSLRCLKD